MKYIIFIFITVLTSSCSFMTRSSVPDVSNSESTAFQQGLDLMKQRQYVESAEYWAQFLKKYPVTKLSASAYYLRARSLEKTNHCGAAIPFYKNAIVMWGVGPSGDKARSLLRIATCYNQLDKTNLAIAELVGLDKYRKYLKWEDYFIERNAQLAIAYAKEENNKEAYRYFSLVDKYIRQALKSDKKISKTWMSELFLQLSDNMRFGKNRKANLISLSAKQSYLVKVIEWDLKVESEEAFDKIKKSYDELSHLFLPIPSNEDLVEKRKASIENKEYAEQLLASLNELKLEFSPAIDETPLIESVKTWADEQIQKWNLYIAQPLPGDELTPSAKKRQSIKQEGTLVPVPVKTKKDPNL